MFFERKPSFPREKLTVRILANVDDVDPPVEDILWEQVQGGSFTMPTVHLVADWFLPRITAQLCLDDGDGCLQWLTQADIAEWGVPQAELFGVAIENLNSKVPNAQLDRLTRNGGVLYSPLCEGVTLSSLILSDRLLRHFDFKKENIAAIIPNRDTYYFCDRTSRESLELLRRMGDIAWDDEDCPNKYRITKTVLVADEQAAFGWAHLQQGSLSQPTD